MKSIRKKITVCLIVTVLIALVAVGSASITLNYRSTVSTVDQMMRQTAILASERIEQELAAYKNIAMDAGCVPQLSSATTLVKEKRVIIDQWVAMHNLQRGNIIGLNGHSIFDGQDFSDRDYVMEAMEGAAGQQGHRGAFHHCRRTHLRRRHPGRTHHRRGLLRPPGDFFE